MDMIRHEQYDVDRSSGLTSGNRKNEKRRNLPTLGSDSSSSSSSVTEEDPFTLELGWRRSSKDTFGVPVKKLLADEMSKEAEMKKRSPGIIAKLMGLDGMPTPRSAYNQQKCSSEGYSQRCISKEKVGRRKSLKDHQEFKDVFEVLETSKIENRRNPDQGAPKFELAESEMAFIRQKFMDAKRLSTDENSHDSKEFHDALDALESNRDLLLKFLHQPGSRFDRHVHDLQDASSCSRRGCSTAIETLDNRKCDYPMFEGNSKRGTPQNNSRKSHYIQHGGRSSHSDSSFSGYFSKSSQILERKDELEHHPTRIVVLKPNIGKVQNARNIVCQSHSFQEPSDLGEFKIVERTNKEFRGRKVSPEKKVVSKHSNKESREICYGKTRQMRNGVISTPPLNLTCSNFQGYAGDESSCSLSGDEFAEEQVVRSVNVKSSSNSNVAYRQSSTRRKESSISREAKKRLSARWKSSRNSKDKGVISRGSTLADMLASNDKEVTLAHSDTRITEERFADKFFNDDDLVKEVEPEGISSNDGWKDGCSQLTKSRSLPALATGFGSPKTVHRSNGTNKHLISKAIQQDNNKAVENQFDKRVSNGILLTSMEFEASCSNVDDRSRISRSVEDVGDAYTMTFPETLDGLALEPLEYMSMVGNSCINDRDSIIQEEESSVESPAPSHISEAAPESLASSKEADQPSPVSVLEPAFRDDLSSSSECFESVSSDIQGLRMQLRLLKLESEPLTERSMLISSNEDATEVSSRLPDEKDLPRTKDSWEFSYLLDILTESGLNDADPGALLATLYSSNCPIDPKIFERLEKKHSCHSSATMSDRRLLFDRINSGILAIGQQFSDPHPWVRPSKTIAKWATKNELQNRLCKFLDTQIVRYDIVEESVRENLGEEIDLIGKEIERLMINELLAEVIFDVIWSDFFSCFQGQ